jgi:hypothetical protein
MKYQDKLEELGMSEKNVSASIKKTIATLNDIISSYNLAQKTKEQSDDEDEINEINSDIEEMEGDIEDLDNSLVDKIEDYHKNKDVYAEKAKKMLDAAKAKREQLLAKENGEPVAVVQASQLAQAKKEAPYVQAKEVPAEQPKKKTNWALWIVAGIIAVVTVNQVMIRTED